jgi:hypothetical protein
MLATRRHGERQPHPAPSCADNAKTRRDLLAMAFGYTAAMAFVGMQAPAEPAPDDVFDGGTP